MQYIVMERIDHQSQKFWEIEEPVVTRMFKLTPQDLEREQYFTGTVSRSKTDEMYTVSRPMPLIEEPTVLGTSREIALRRFQQVEIRILGAASQVDVGARLNFLSLR